MNPAGQALGVLLVIAGLVGAGFIWGDVSRNDEVAALVAQRNEKVREAEGANATVTTLKASIRQAKVEREAQARKAQEELARRGDRIAALERDAQRRHNNMLKRIDQDANCDALRRLPVCAAVADGLWGAQAAGKD